MTWQESIKKAQELAEKLELLELKEAINALKMRILEIENEKMRLQLENQELKKKVESATSLIYEAPFYWKIANEKKEGPFCPICWDTSSKAIHLQMEVDKGWVCKVCHNTFDEDKHSAFRFNPPF